LRAVTMKPTTAQATATTKNHGAQQQADQHDDETEVQPEVDRGATHRVSL
jgi:hypothetical protein